MPLTTHSHLAPWLSWPVLERILLLSWLPHFLHFYIDAAVKLLYHKLDRPTRSCHLLYDIKTCGDAVGHSAKTHISNFIKIDSVVPEVKHTSRHDHPQSSFFAGHTKNRHYDCSSVCHKELLRVRPRDCPNHVYKLLVANSTAGAPRSEEYADCLLHKAVELLNKAISAAEVTNSGRLSRTDSDPLCKLRATPRHS